MPQVDHDQSIEAQADGVRGLLLGFPAGTVTVVAHHSTTLRPILEAIGVAHAEAETVDTNSGDNLVLVLLPEGAPPQMLKLRCP